MTEKSIKATHSVRYVGRYGVNKVRRAGRQASDDGFYSRADEALCMGNAQQKRGCQKLLRCQGLQQRVKETKGKRGMFN